MKKLIFYVMSVMTVIFVFSLFLSEVWAQASTIQWQKCLGGTGVDKAYSIKQATDGGYIVDGLSYSFDGDVTGNHGNGDFWIVKLDTVGNIEWQKSFGGGYGDIAYSIQQTVDGGYIVAGLSYSFNGDVIGNHDGGDCWIVKLDSVGNIEWQKCLGGTLDDQAHSVQQTTDSGYIVAGSSWSSDGDVTDHHGTNSYADFWIVKLDSAGNIE